MATKTSSSNSEPTMAELLNRSKNRVQTFTKTQRIEAKLLSKTPSLLVFDIGGKSEGLVKGKGYVDAKEYIETIKVGDMVLVTILVPESRDGTIVLGLKDAMHD